MAQSYVIRPATADDQAFISEMQYEASFVPPGADLFPRDVLDEPNITEYRVGFGTRAGDVGFVAESADGDRLGAAWVRLVDGYGFVDRLTPELGIDVMASARGRGIGTSLLGALLARVPRCSLGIDTRNPDLRLYERSGFRGARNDGECTAVMLRDGAPS
jgi:GNAT superfamily N-acetyltransferase